MPRLKMKKIIEETVVLDNENIVPAKDNVFSAADVILDETTAAPDENITVSEDDSIVGHDSIGIVGYDNTGIASVDDGVTIIDEKEIRKSGSKKEKVEEKEPNQPKVKKNAILYILLTKSNGASLAELEEKLGWKQTSIRGVISNMQKESRFCLVTVDISRPNLEGEGFIKETRYFIKDSRFMFESLFDSTPVVGNAVNQ